MRVSYIIPSYNNLQHLKNVYESVKKHAPDAELILMDDGSTDGTWEWMQDKDCIKYRSETRIGHTILYDVGIDLATNEIVGILHADMILGANYTDNLLKHLERGKVVCATRIEPPLHPEGKEKIIRDFGQDFDTLDVSAFEQYVSELQVTHKDETTRGMFAPWVIYKEDFKAIGGHDPLFAPFPYEDSDIFQRWIMAGYELVQSRDAFVYHLTCRGHRWNEQVGKDDDYYKVVSDRAARNYIRKWGSWIKNDEYQHPIVPVKYDIAFVVKSCNLDALRWLEPWCSHIYIEDDMQVSKTAYLEMEQQNTSYDLSDKVRSKGYVPVDADIIVEFDMHDMDKEAAYMLQMLPDIIKDSGEIGTFELHPFKITINNMVERQTELTILSK